MAALYSWHHDSLRSQAELILYQAKYETFLYMFVVYASVPESFNSFQSCGLHRAGKSGIVI
jgi:hypothetical protein